MYEGGGLQVIVSSPVISYTAVNAGTACKRTSVEAVLATCIARSRARWAMPRCNWLPVLGCMRAG